MPTLGHHLFEEVLLEALSPAASTTLQCVVANCAAALPADSDGSLSSAIRASSEPGSPTEKPADVEFRQGLPCRLYTRSR
jgi:hypothetical protein